ncbi:tetratricopeptide repeat protein [Algoriphagus litoralis]|uniref:tetratricopeptide repeat protein n=1 Tax=Algoriphagus litoralis TaxID=2202829 RepID=UPI000DB95B48|nr:tetratricopeptide repeat protein [Algoriphagus litoralis]
MKRLIHILTIFSSLSFLFSCAVDPAEIEAMYNAGKFEQTISEIDKRLFFHVTDVKFLHMRARSYEELEQFDNAIKDYERIISIDENYAQAFAGIGKILFEQEKYAQAELYILRASTIDPENFDILYLAGRCLLMVGKWDKAERFLTLAEKLDPDFAQIHFYMGMARANRGEVEGAAVSFNSYVNKEPDNLVARYNRGFAMMRLGYIPYALEDFEFILTKNPNHIEAMAKKGICLAKMGNPEGCKLIQQAANRGSDYALSHLDELCK